jgi:hypothetical protein
LHDRVSQLLQGRTADAGWDDLEQLHGSGAADCIGLAFRASQLVAVTLALRKQHSQAEADLIREGKIVAVVARQLQI